MNEEHCGIGEELLPKVTHNPNMSEEGTGQSSDVSTEGAGQSTDVRVQVVSDTGKIHKYLYKFKGIKPYKCGVCNEEFYDQASVERHISSHAIKRPKRFLCRECGAEFDRKILLEEHKLHADIKEYKCKSKKCKRSFHTKQALLVHDRRSHRDRPFQCSICENSYVTVIMLKKHMATHDEPLYKCGLCRKVFPQPKFLRKHMKEHADGEHGAESGQVYNCDACQKEFSEKSKLQALSVDIDNKSLKIYFCNDCKAKEALSQVSVKTPECTPEVIQID
ncbi:zinc finger protein 891-like isoform X2 [Mytilus trossulus]|uniref:zinc finger protein 891-like isoform X2 n=1 Tax=Mytilus trossulus TaxID=6551 RepID=UPI0030063CDD